MKIKGKIESIFDSKIYRNSYKKREFVVLTDEQWPQFLIMEFVNENCNILNNYKEGDVVDVDFSLRGTEWTNPEGKKVYFKFIRVNEIRKLSKTFQKFEKINITHFQMEINKHQN